MKYTFTLIALLLSVCAARAQTYLEDGMTWRLHSMCTAVDTCYTYDLYHLYIDGDTVIGNVLYKRVFQHGMLSSVSNTYPYSPEPGCPNGEYDRFYTLLRQEGHRMYRYLPPYGDTLLYDFDLETGDFYPPGSGGPYEVLGIGQGQINGETRRVFAIGIPAYGFDYLLAEGIGHANGFLEPVTGVGDPDSCLTLMGCFQWNGDIWVINSAICYASVGENTSLRELTAYPNPVKSSCRIETSSFGQVERIEAIDSRGQVFQVFFHPANNEEIEVDIAHFAPGLYLLRLYGDDVPAQVKIMKE